MDALPFILTGAVTSGLVLKMTRTRMGRFESLLCVATLASSALLIQLVLWEVLVLGSTELRAQLWWALTGILLVLLAFVYPAVYIARNLVWGRLGLLRVPLSVLVYAGYLVAFAVVSTKLPVERDSRFVSDDESRLQTIRQDTLACISCLGITVMAVLCGISSISAPYTAFFHGQPPVTEATVQRVRLSLQNTDGMIQEQELVLNRLRLDIKNRTRKSSTNLVAKLVSAMRPDDIYNDLRTASTELQTLQRLRGELMTERYETQVRLERQDFDRTVLGRVRSAVYAVFAIYCVYRVLNSFLRLGWWVANVHHEAGASGPRDGLVLMLAQWLHKQYPSFTADNWSRLVGVFMSGAVFVAALNGLIQSMKKIMRTWFRKGNASIFITEPLVLSNVVGVYVLSIATVLRLNIPKAMSGAIIHALASPLSVDSIQWWNDVVLCLTSVVTIVALLLASYLERGRVLDEEALEKYD